MAHTIRGGYGILEGGEADTGYPLHREDRENGKKNPCQGKQKESGNFAKTWGKHREFGLLKL